MTPEGWERRKVREFSERLKRVNAEGQDIEPLSVTKDRGVVPQSEKYHKRIATDPRRYVIAEDGDFAFDPMSLYYGAIGRVRGVGRGLVSPDYVVFKADTTVHHEFLDALLRFPEMHKVYESLSETGNSFGKRRRLYWSIFEEIDLLLPPVPEQRKIAAILSSVDDAIEATQAVIDQLGVVKKAMMAELLTRGLPGRHTRFKQTEIGEVPEEWEVRPLSDLAAPDQHSFVIGPFGSDLVASDYRDSGVPVVFVRDVKPNFFRWKSNVFLTREKATQLQAHRVEAGDVVITKMGLPAGIAALYPDHMPDGIVTADIIRLRVDASRVHAAFLAQCINGPAVSAQVDQITGGQTRPKITLRDFRAIHAPVPSLGEQRDIAAILECIDSRTAAESLVLRELAVTKSAVMSVLLTGEVRVVGLQVEPPAGSTPTLSEAVP